MSEHNPIDNSKEVLESLRPNKIIIPILLGVGVVVWMLAVNFDMESVNAINWKKSSSLLVALAVLMAGVRQFAYMWRIRSLTDKTLSWKQAFQVISVWEFSSAITPTMVGGTAVGLFLLTKEKINAGKATALILFTIFLDSVFFLGLTIIFWLAYGNVLLSPKFKDLTSYTIFSGDVTVYGFFIAFLFMCAYTLIITYGLFVNPRMIKWVLLKLTSNPLLRRWKKSAAKLGDDISIASAALKKEPTSFWLKGLGTTALAWSSRFMVVVFLVMAVVQVQDIFLVFGRQMALYFMLLITPTPGGAGVAEGVFTTFYNDFLPDKGLAIAVGGMWRLLTYWPYLILGALILPSWIKRVYSLDKNNDSDYNNPDDALKNTSNASPDTNISAAASQNLVDSK
ncbi:MAG: lysylphosphatidylglycerol synthase transmembrane domain-containing protein [Chitinophagales bacterium]|nr:flippase-like domain-containing protein [Bacteroidota bacterium]MCB9043763.1 flippase-like domain-containing protein [Chitinophagales bacterium]